MSRLFSRMSILKDQTADGLERPLQFQDKIFIEDWGKIQCPLTFEKKEPLSSWCKKWIGVLGGSSLGRLGWVVFQTGQRCLCHLKA